MQHYFSGRAMPIERSPFSKEAVEEAIERGDLTVRPAVQTTPQFVCERCQTNKKHHFYSWFCERCQAICWYCRNCIKMGRMASCTQLATWTGQAIPYPQVPVLNWQGQLTDAQAVIAERFATSVITQQPHLLYAVCGAGKTEMIFQAIGEALAKGWRLAVVAPRVDVIVELAPRFQQAFPTVSIGVYYGGAPTTPHAPQLVLATTHQLYRFEKAFDAIIVDEADAFPYTADETLQLAVKKAKKSHAAIHVITATPAKQLLRTYEREGTQSILPRRYHGHPLPVPIYCSLFRYPYQVKKGVLPSKVRQWVQKCLANETPFLLFCPTIELVKRVAKLLQEMEPTIVGVYAEHPERRERILQVRAGERAGLVTTTILERGVTIPRVQVAVIGAEQPVFTAAALIQISGRVGRSALDPKGEVCFFHAGISRAMDQARKTITRLNAQEVSE